jgi:hypothetical protein
VAHKLDLEYEYDLATRTVKISQPIPDGSIDPVPEYNSFTNYNPLENIGGTFENTSDDAPRAAGRALGDFSFEMSQTEVDAPMYDLANETLDASNKSPPNILRFEFENIFSPGEGSYQVQRSISDAYMEATDPALPYGEEEDPRTEGYYFYPDLTIAHTSKDAAPSSDRFVLSSSPIYDTNEISEI